MKLKNKLLPLTAVLATSAIVAPLSMTSCTTSNTDGSGTVDVINGYYPTISKMEAYTDKSESDVENLYVKSFEKNKNVLLQDIGWWESTILPYRIKNVEYYFSKSSLAQQGLTPIYYSEYSGYAIRTIPSKAEFTITNPVINTVTVKHPTSQQNIQIHTISMQLDYEFNYDIIANCRYERDATKTAIAKQQATNKFTSTYKNMPFAIKYNSEYQTFELKIIGYLYNDGWILDALNGWEFSFNYDYAWHDETRHVDGQVYECDESDNEHNTINTTDGMKQALEALAETSPDSGSINYYCANFGLFHTLDVMAPKFTTSMLGYDGWYKDEGWEDMDNDNNWYKYTSTQRLYPDPPSYNIYFGGVDYNYSYDEYYKQDFIENASLNLSTDLNLQVYHYGEKGHAGFPIYEDVSGNPMYLKIAKDANMIISYAWEFEMGFTCHMIMPGTLEWSLSQPYQQHGNYFDFNDYYVIIPAGTYSINANFHKSGQKQLSFTIDHDVIVSWDEFTTIL